MPSPSSAVMIGRPIATTEPKVMSRTTIAASSPIAVAAPSDGFCTDSIAWPPSATCSCGVAAACAVLDHVFHRRRRQQVRALVEGDGCERDLAVGGERLRAGCASRG